MYWLYNMAMYTYYVTKWDMFVALDLGCARVAKSFMKRKQKIFIFPFPLRIFCFAVHTLYNNLHD